MGTINKTYNSDLRVWDTVFKEKMKSFPAIEGEFKRAHDIFMMVVNVINIGAPGTQISFPKHIGVSITKIRDYNETICVTHKPSGYGWGYNYGAYAQDFRVEIPDEYTIKICQAKFVWMVCVTGGEDSLTGDPRYVRCFENREDAFKWSKTSKFGDHEIVKYNLY